MGVVRKQGRARRGSCPNSDERNEGVAKVRFIREVVDPVEWLQNFRSAVDYIEGEPNVDPSRIGAWGTSFGGGIAMHNAANDDRIKVLAVQVASLDRSERPAGVRMPSSARSRSPGERSRPFRKGSMRLSRGSPGTPHLARFLQYNAIEEVRKLRVPTLMMDAGNEELFDIRENSGKAYEMLKSQATAPVDYRIIDGIDHYGIYFDGFDERQRGSARVVCQAPLSSALRRACVQAQCHPRPVS